MHLVLTLIILDGRYNGFLAHKFALLHIFIYKKEEF